jgi:hypothetical protein
MDYHARPVVDLGAEKLIAAKVLRENGVTRFAKSRGFHWERTRFSKSRYALELLPKCLAVPQDTYETFFQHDLNVELVAEHQLKIIIYNSDSEILVQ